MTTETLKAQLTPLLRKITKSIVELEKRVDKDEREFDNLSKQVMFLQ